jgi:hypothetical protein
MLQNLETRNLQLLSNKLERLSFPAQILAESLLLSGATKGATLGL